MLIGTLNANWKYHLLGYGDEICEGDEWYNPEFDRWQPVTDGEVKLKWEGWDMCASFPDAVIGYEWDSDEHKPTRRKNPDYVPVK